MTEHAWRVLQYDQLIHQLSAFASSSLGLAKVKAMRPVFDLEQVRHNQQATFEGKEVIRLKGNVPLGGVTDITPFIKRAVIGSRLNTTELLDIAQLLYSVRTLLRFMKPLLDELELPIMSGWLAQMTPARELEQDIRRCIGDQGDMLDSASARLRQTRSVIRNLEQRIKQQLEQMTKSTSIQKMLQEAIVTIRNGRYCLPVKAEHRAQFRGMVHDQSASGATLFIEPSSVITLNNQLREEGLKEEKEVERILYELTAAVATHAQALSDNTAAMAEVDFMFAKAYYAQEIRGVQPQLNASGLFSLKNARHPFISAEEVVPVSFDLGHDHTALIITGPNTGGKTVTLKTLGLLTLMACSGLFVPAEEGTELAVVSSVHADIGDEQSIEQNLSTFSGHMTNIIHILNNIDAHSLVLFDELGAGTDPTEGAALAIAILDHVCSTGAKVVATTHYSELKAYASVTEGVCNASVEFDVETLRPTYRLLVGIPGRSNAFSIAARLGLPQQIIEHARAQLSTDDVQVESMLSVLEKNQKQAEWERKVAADLRRELQQKVDALRLQEEKLVQEKDNMLQEAALQAAEYVERAKREADQIILDLRAYQEQAQTEAVKDHVLIEARKKLEQSATVASSMKAEKRSTGKRAPLDLQPGDTVYVHTFKQQGHIVEKLSEREYVVQLGVLKMKVDQEAIEKIQEKAGEPAARLSSVTRAVEQGKTVKFELDIRGKSVDEAVPEIDKYLDDALLSGYEQVHIIHGKGTGQLRKGVHNFLDHHQRVQSTRLGGAGEGGSGVTVVTLR